MFPKYSVPLALLWLLPRSDTIGMRITGNSVGITCLLIAWLYDLGNADDKFYSLPKSSARKYSEFVPIHFTLVAMVLFSSKIEKAHSKNSKHIMEMYYNHNIKVILFLPCIFVQGYCQRSGTHNNLYSTWISKWVIWFEKASKRNTVSSVYKYIPL